MYLFHAVCPLFLLNPPLLDDCDGWHTIQKDQRSVIFCKVEALTIKQYPSPKTNRQKLLKNRKNLGQKESLMTHLPLHPFSKAKCVSFREGICLFYSTSSWISRWWFQICFMFTPTWGKISNLTNIFQMG